MTVHLSQTSLSREPKRPHQVGKLMLCSDSMLDDTKLRSFEQLSSMVFGIARCKFRALDLVSRRNVGGGA